MHASHKIITSLILITLLSGATGVRALAAPPADPAQPPNTLALQCDQAGCTAAAALPGVPGLIKTGVGLLLSLAQDQSDNPSGDTRVTLDDDLMVSLPTGQVHLPNAHLALELGKNNRVNRLHGTAEVPFPTFDALADVTVLKPAVAEVGLDKGSALRHLNAPLDDNRQYLFFTFGSGFDVSAKTHGATRPFDLSVPAGQRATLIVDTQEPMVYLAGNVTVSHDDHIALVGKLLEPVQNLGTLPLRQRTQVALSGQMGKAPDHRALEIGVAHAVDAGVIGDWLGVDTRPLAVEGLLTMTGNGLLLEGVVSSSIAPDLLLDANARLDAFIPFNGEMEDAYLLVQAHATMPVAKITADASAKVTWPIDVETSAQVVRQPSNATAGRPAEQHAASPAIKQALAAAGTWAAGGLQRAGEVAAAGGSWLAHTAATGAETVADLLPGGEE